MQMALVGGGSLENLGRGEGKVQKKIFAQGND